MRFICVHRKSKSSIYFLQIFLSFVSWRLEYAKTKINIKKHYFRMIATKKKKGYPLFKYNDSA